MVDIDFIDLQLTCIAQAVYHEANTESKEAKLGVAYVILNRMRMSHKDACEVVFAKGQFSGIADMVMLKHEPASKEDLLKAKLIAHAAWYHTETNPVGRAMYFHDDSIKPVWAFRNAHIVKINNLIFY